MHDELVREIREGPAGRRSAPSSTSTARCSRASPPSRSSASASSRGASRRGSSPSRPSRRARLRPRAHGLLGHDVGDDGRLPRHQESVLEEIGEDVFVKHLAARIYPRVARAGATRTSERGHTVAIVSSATRYQAEPLARDLGIEHVLCTRLEVEARHLHRAHRAPDLLRRGQAPLRAGARRARRPRPRPELLLHRQRRRSAAARGRRPAAPAESRPPARQLARDRGWPVRRFSSRGQPGLGDLVRTRARLREPPARRAGPVSASRSSTARGARRQRLGLRLGRPRDARSPASICASRARSTSGRTAPRSSSSTTRARSTRS